jgi:hypothetical protein
LSRFLTPSSSQYIYLGPPRQNVCFGDSFIRISERNEKKDILNFLQLSLEKGSPLTFPFLSRKSHRFSIIFIANQVGSIEYILNFAEEKEKAATENVPMNASDDDKSLFHH